MTKVDYNKEKQGEKDTNSKISIELSNQRIVN